MITILPGPEDVQFHCHKRTGKHRVRVALHQHEVGRFLFEHTSDPRQDPVGPVGFGEWGFDLFCWLSRVLVSPAGSTDLLRLEKRSRYIPPEPGEDPHRIPRTFVASGGIAIPPYAPPPWDVLLLTSVRWGTKTRYPPKSS